MTAKRLTPGTDASLIHRAKKQRLSSNKKECQTALHDRAVVCLEKVSSPPIPTSCSPPPPCDLGDIYVQILESCRPFYFGTDPVRKREEEEEQISDCDSSSASATTEVGSSSPILSPRLEDALELRKKKRETQCSSFEDCSEQALDVIYTGTTSSSPVSSISCLDQAFLLCEQSQ
mmetsp:Transcript_40733/g.75407  ORF Transcript_40733/g.75407 Transcript_40733/m.75407 type:complete len:175 (-) Transcript_40733:187-711(-)